MKLDETTKKYVNSFIHLGGIIDSYYSSSRHGRPEEREKIQ